MLYILFLLVLNINTSLASFSKDDFSSRFSATISSLNPSAKTMRLRSDFKNIKFFNRNDRIYFATQDSQQKSCAASVLGKTSRYLLVRVPTYTFCIKNIHMTVGTALTIFSVDLKKNMETVGELNQVLLKRRMATEARLVRLDRELQSYMQKLDTLNKNYEILRQKMEIEWKQELDALENDKLATYEKFKKTQEQLHELSFKRKQFEVANDNLTVDKWSLDRKRYFKK